MPMAAIFSTVMPALEIASAATPNCVLHISLGSCSTQPGCGNSWVNSFCAMLFIIPFLSKTIARELVVPWSKASIYCGIVNKQLGAENKSFTPIVQEELDILAIIFVQMAMFFKSK